MSNDNSNTLRSLRRTRDPVQRLQRQYLTNSSPRSFKTLDDEKSLSGGHKHIIIITQTDAMTPNWLRQNEYFFEKLDKPSC